MELLKRLSGVKCELLPRKRRVKPDAEIHHPYKLGAIGHKNYQGKTQGLPRANFINSRNRASNGSSNQLALSRNVMRKKQDYLTGYKIIKMGLAAYHRGHRITIVVTRGEKLAFFATPRVAYSKWRECEPEVY